jgi:hypothetical protein
VLLLAPVSPGSAQTVDPKPEELGKQRSALFLRATHAPLTDIESDVNQLTVVSESCRVKYGSTACGLPDKAIESGNLEERFDYYVRQPVEAHAKGRAVKVDRRNWTGVDLRAHP